LHIDPQLLHDGHLLGTLGGAAVLLNRNASVGWLILVPDTDAVDWHELDDAEHSAVSTRIRALSGFAARWFAADKLNVATLGNVVRQMHAHVIARRFDDPCWPQPVWGNLDTHRPYTDSEVHALQAALERDLSLAPSAAV